MRTVEQLRGLTTIVDCLVRQKYGVNNLEEIQILSVGEKLVLATNDYASAGTVRGALNNHCRCEDFERMMFLVYVLVAEVLGTQDRLRNSFQQRMILNVQYGGNPARWADAWRGANIDEANAVRKIAKTVILRKMRHLNRFNDLFSEQNYKDRVLTPYGINLNKIDSRDLALAVLVAGTDDVGVNLQAEDRNGTQIPLHRYQNAASATGVLGSPLATLVYNADDYPHKEGDRIHAEQHLVSLLVDVARRDEASHSANIGGKKVACGTCRPIMDRFTRAYEAAYAPARINNPLDLNGAQGGGAGGTLEYTEDNKKNDESDFDTFIDEWLADED